MATIIYELSGIDYPIIALPHRRDVVAAVSLVHEAARATAHRDGRYRCDSGVIDVDRSANGGSVRRSRVEHRAASARRRCLRKPQAAALP